METYIYMEPNIKHVMQQILHGVTLDEIHKAQEPQQAVEPPKGFMQSKIGQYLFATESHQDVYA